MIIYWFHKFKRHVRLSQTRYTLLGHMHNITFKHCQLNCQLKIIFQTNLKLLKLLKYIHNVLSL